MSEKAMRGYEMNIEYLVKLLWKRVLWVLISTMLVCDLAVSYSALLMPDKYSSTVKFYVNNSFQSDEQMPISSSDIFAASELLDIYIVILKSTPTLERIIESSALDIEVKDLKNMITAASVDGTEVFFVTALANDAETAQKLANSVAEVLPERISEVVEGSSVKLVEGADKPGEKVSGSTLKYALIGAAAGFIISCAAVVIYDLFDKTLKTEKQFAYFARPVLARIKTSKSNYSKEYRKAAELLCIRGARAVGVFDRMVALALKDAFYDLGEAAEIVELCGNGAELDNNCGYKVVILPPNSIMGAKETDGIIVSVTYGKTRSDELEELVERLNFAGVRLLGFVTFDK